MTKGMPLPGDCRKNEGMYWVIERRLSIRARRKTGRT
jgi:hypothetical protein